VQFLVHGFSPVARAELPGTVASTAQRKLSQGRRRPRPQARKARAALDGENAVLTFGDTASQPFPYVNALSAKFKNRIGGMRNEAKAHHMSPLTGNRDDK